MLNLDFPIKILPLPAFILQGSTIKLSNHEMACLTGYATEELNGLYFPKIVHPEDRSHVLNFVKCFLAEETTINECQFRAFRQSGEVIPLRGAFSRIFFNGSSAMLGQLITIRVDLQHEEIADSLPVTVFEMDVRGYLTYANSKAFETFGYEQQEFDRGINVLQTLIPEDRFRAENNIRMVLKGQILNGIEYTAQRKNGSTFPVIIHSCPIIKENEPVGLRGVIIDITDRKQTEEKLKYLSLHDPMTGLKNRAYFENEMQQIREKHCGRVGIIICDVDGLKIVNDTFGHDSGDNLLIAAGKVIKGCFRDSDVVARIGGDEFAVLLRNSSVATLKSAYRRIREAIASYNSAKPEFPMSISVGFTASVDAPINIDELFKDADNKMYREKLYHSQSVRSTIVETLMKALGARDFLTDGHSNRLKALIEGLGRAIGLTKSKSLTDLRLLAHFHDIGKVGITDNILFKSGPLNFEEYTEMKRHCEIGYRIAQSAPDLAPIADWILKHHEWWNGEGYPLGLKGEEIPLECRILAIADAYDAIISDRPYRKANSHKAAVNELVNCTGTQYDPHLVPIFVEMLAKNRKSH